MWHKNFVKGRWQLQNSSFTLETGLHLTNEARVSAVILSLTTVQWTAFNPYLLLGRHHLFPWQTASTLNISSRALQAFFPDGGISFLQRIKFISATTWQSSDTYISTSNATTLLWPLDTCVTSHLKPNNLWSCWLGATIAILGIKTVCSIHFIWILHRSWIPPKNLKTVLCSTSGGLEDGAISSQMCSSSS